MDQSSTLSCRLKTTACNLPVNETYAQMHAVYNELRVSQLPMMESIRIQTKITETSNLPSANVTIIL